MVKVGDYKLDSYIKYLTFYLDSCPAETLKFMQRNNFTYWKRTKDSHTEQTLVPYKGPIKTEICECFARYEDMHIKNHIALKKVEDNKSNYMCSVTISENFGELGIHDVLKKHDSLEDAFEDLKELPIFKMLKPVYIIDNKKEQFNKYEKKMRKGAP